MFKRIMIPVDLAHLKTLEKALKAGAVMARSEGAPVTYVSVTSDAPGSLAHTPQEFEKKLNAFASEQAAAHGITADAKMIVANDPAVDLDGKLMRAADEMGADLIVMASHVPGLSDYIWPSNGGTLAGHSKASVFVVRDQG
ncbi:universal stress protein [Jannaschia seohaensis]|uniref:Nucleotide-binding universal stress UspA family protein n=1 Tax=Jannaschia seohaensis TaxID=475081 RepID=A0A2Y9AKC7_9RHOB|nr:universal stress protein [Jannaschia seohaensis]PWJ20519.1 nucleotide-binding universal stress UspA family protein [Jannaschia seohaensis]SSA44615.1 Nucleotide-binding universal stress protein, UspA family [Jannaschia seohaensis]